jgi:hypothetical protein
MLSLRFNSMPLTLIKEVMKSPLKYFIYVIIFDILKLLFKIDLVALRIILRASRMKLPPNNNPISGTDV